MAVSHVLLPKEAVLQYEHNNILFIKDDDPTRRRRELIWTAAQNLICHVNIHPSDWFLSPDAIYRYLASQKYSWDYSKRIVYALNCYGQLYCRLMQMPFYPIQLDDPKRRIVIEESFDGDRQSEPLRIESLCSLRSRVPHEMFSWLWIAFWFGLRPQEVDMLKSRSWNDGMATWWLEDDEKTLVVYQPKLQMVKPKKRYRRIPILYAEQEEALRLMMSGKFERPSDKQTGRWLSKEVSLYGCRHGFACYMDAKGIDIYAISRWLGHQSVKTTEHYYVRLGMRRDPLDRFLNGRSRGLGILDFLKNISKAIYRILLPRYLIS